MMRTCVNVTKVHCQCFATALIHSDCSVPARDLSSSNSHWLTHLGMKTEATQPDCDASATDVGQQPLEEARQGPDESCNTQRGIIDIADIPETQV